MVLRVWLRSPLLLLDLLLLLLEDLALLHLLHDLLRRTDGAAGSKCAGWVWSIGIGTGLVVALRLWWRWRLRRLFDDVLGHIFFIVILRGRIRDPGSVRSSCVPRAQNDLARSSLSQIAGQKDVVARPLQKLIEHIPCFCPIVSSRKRAGLVPGPRSLRQCRRKLRAISAEGLNSKPQCADRGCPK